MSFFRTKLAIAVLPALIGLLLHFQSVQPISRLMDLITPHVHPAFFGMSTYFIFISTLLLALYCVYLQLRSGTDIKNLKKAQQGEIHKIKSRANQKVETFSNENAVLKDQLTYSMMELGRQRFMLRNRLYQKMIKHIFRHDLKEIIQNQQKMMPSSEKLTGMVTGVLLPMDTFDLQSLIANVDFHKDIVREIRQNPGSFLATYMNLCELIDQILLKESGSNPKDIRNKEWQDYGKVSVLYDKEKIEHPIKTSMFFLMFRNLIRNALGNTRPESRVLVELKEQEKHIQILVWNQTFVTENDINAIGQLPELKNPKDQMPAHGYGAYMAREVAHGYGGHLVWSETVQDNFNLNLDLFTNKSRYQLKLSVRYLGHTVKEPFDIVWSLFINESLVNDGELTLAENDDTKDILFYPNEHLAEEDCITFAHIAIEHNSINLDMNALDSETELFSYYNTHSFHSSVRELHLNPAEWSLSLKLKDISGVLARITLPHAPVEALNKRNNEAQESANEKFGTEKVDELVKNMFEDDIYV